MTDAAFTAALMASSAGLSILTLAVLRWAFDRLKSKNGQTVAPSSQPPINDAIERLITHEKETREMVKEIRRETMAIARLAEQTNDVHRVIDQRDEDGVPLVYSRKSLERAIDRMTQAMTTQTQVLQQLAMKMDLAGE